MAAKKKYKCEYCNTILRHDSPSVRKTHLTGKKHKESVRLYYQTFLDELTKTMVTSSKMKKMGLFASKSMLGANNMMPFNLPNMPPLAQNPAFANIITPMNMPPMQPGMFPMPVNPNLPPPGMFPNLPQMPPMMNLNMPPPSMNPMGFQ